MQHIEYNLLYRWFVGLSMDDGVWAATTFTENRERLFTEAVMREFFGKVLALAQWKKLTSHEHFTVDGTLIDAWASHKSFVPRDASGNPPEGGSKNPTVDFKGEKRSNDTHVSTTDPEARLFTKSEGDKSRLCYMGHVLIKNRSGLVVDVETTQASGTAEREAAAQMVQRSVPAGSTLGADKGYDTSDFVQAMREAKVTPHVAAKKSVSAIDGRTIRHATYALSLKKAQTGRGNLWLGKDHRRSAQDPLYWLGQGEGANRFHLRLLQSDPDGDAVRLAIVCNIGRNPPADCRKANCKPEGAMKTGKNPVSRHHQGWWRKIFHRQHQIAEGIREFLIILLVFWK